jgi:polyisoprenoid-binding protein YceI
MKLKLALITVVTAMSTFAGYVAFHPGVQVIEPRLAHAAETPLSSASYTIDPMHASIYFEIAHLGLSQIHGRFNKFEGKIFEDAQHPENSRVQFSAEANSIDTGVEARDNHLRTADFFDVAQFPALSFTSTGLTPGRDSYILHGNLTLHGVTRPVDIEFHHRGPYVMQGKDGKPQPAKIGIIAEPLTIKRSEFGIGKTDPMQDGTMGLSDEVTVYISFEATRDTPATGS